MATDDEFNDEETDYRGLVRASVWAAGSVFVVKSLALLLLAWHYGAAIEIRRLFGLIPYVGFRTTRPIFMNLVSFSGLAMGSAAALFFIIALLARRGRDDHRHGVIGWFVGVLIAFITLAIESVRHLLDQPMLRLEWGVQTAAVLLAATVLFVAFVPRKGAHEASTARVRGLDTQAHPQTHKQELPQT